MESKLVRIAQRALLCILCFVYVIGCKKSTDDPAPAPPIDLAAKVIGRYKLISIGQNNPVGGPVFVTRTGNVVVTRQGTAFDQVTFNLSITRNTIENGSVVTITSAEDKLMTLKDAGKAVDLYAGSTKLGTWSGDTISVRDYGFSGQTVDSKTVDFVATR